MRSISNFPIDALHTDTKCYGVGELIIDNMYNLNTITVTVKYKDEDTTFKLVKIHFDETSFKEFVKALSGDLKL